MSCWRNRFDPNRFDPLAPLAFVTYCYPEHFSAIPVGSWLIVTGGFDNSAANPANPDPKKRVHFGQQSGDEMFIGFFDAADDPGITETTSLTDAPSADGVKKRSRNFH